MSTVSDPPENSLIPVAELLARSGTVVEEGSGGRRRLADPVEPPAPEPKPSRKWAYITAVLVIVVLAGAAYALYFAFAPQTATAPTPTLGEERQGAVPAAVVFPALDATVGPTPSPAHAPAEATAPAHDPADKTGSPDVEPVVKTTVVPTAPQPAVRLPAVTIDDRTTVPEQRETGPTSPQFTVPVIIPDASKSTEQLQQEAWDRHWANTWDWIDSRGAEN